MNKDLNTSALDEYLNSQDMIERSTPKMNDDEILDEFNNDDLIDALIKSGSFASDVVAMLQEDIPLTRRGEKWILEDNIDKWPLWLLRQAAKNMLVLQNNAFDELAGATGVDRVNKRLRNTEKGEL